MTTPESRADDLKKIPCWGNGISGPKECDESYACELHYRIKDVIEQAIAAHEALRGKP